MFATTLTLTVDGTDYTLNRVNQDNYGSEYSFENSDRIISMLIRHSTDNAGGQPHKRHNVFVEHTVYATPTTFERYWSATITLRNRKTSGPDELLDLWQGVRTLVAASLEAGLVVGSN